MSIAVIKDPTDLPLMSRMRPTIRGPNGVVPNPRYPTELVVSEPNEKHQARIGQFLSHMRHEKEGWGADVNLKLGQEQDSVHSAVIAAHSRLFRRILEKEKPPITIDLSKYKLERQMLRKAIEFMYDGQITLAKESLSQLLHTAITLKIKELQRLLENYLTILSEEGSWMIACLNLCYDLDISEDTRQQIVKKAIERDVFGINKDKVAELSPNAFQALIEYDKGIIRNEGQIFQAALVWLTFVAERKVYADRVFESIGFGQMNEEGKKECYKMIHKQMPDLERALTTRLNQVKRQANKSKMTKPTRLRQEESEKMMKKETKMRMKEEEKSEKERKELNKENRTTGMGMKWTNEDIYGRIKIVENSVLSSADESEFDLNAYPPLSSDINIELEPFDKSYKSLERDQIEQKDAYGRIRLRQAGSKRMERPLLSTTATTQTRAIDVTRDKYGRQIVCEHGTSIASDPFSQLEVNQYEDLPEAQEFLGGTSPRQVVETKNGFGRKVVHEVTRKDSSSQAEFVQYGELPTVYEHKWMTYEVRDGKDKEAISNEFDNWTRGYDTSMNEKQRAVAGSSEDDIQISQYQDPLLEKSIVESYFGLKRQHSDYCFENQPNSYEARNADETTSMISILSKKKPMQGLSQPHAIVQM